MNENLPYAVVNSDEDIERFLHEFQEKHQGERKGGEIMINTVGTEVKPLPRLSADMDYAQSFEEMCKIRNLILAAFCVSKTAVDITGGGSYSGRAVSVMEFRQRNLKRL